MTTYRMFDQDLSVAVGAPSFSNPSLEKMAVNTGAIYAWHEAFSSLREKAPCSVSGDFSVALSMCDGTTFLAVDRFSIQPLCYRVENGRLRFAARADALADPGREIDPQAIYDYLYFHSIPSPRTIYKHVFRLPPGHFALFEEGKLTVAPYWTPEFVENRRSSFSELKNEFRQLLNNAVVRQLDSGQPACFLSGGTDSSTIAGVANLISPKQVASYSIGFEAKGYDEMAYAKLASRHFKTKHHAYYVTPDDLVKGIANIASYFDQPFGNSSALPAYYCAKMAQENGVTKLLAGDGGDELFGGNTRYSKSKLFSLYGYVPNALKNSLLEPLLHNRFSSNSSLTRKVSSYIEQARVPMPDRLQMYNLIIRLGAVDVLTPQLLAQVETQSPLRLQQTVWNKTQDCSALNRELAYDWRFTLAESDLPKVRGATQLAGIDVGFPLLDDRLLAFSQQLPSHYKLKNFQLRWFFKEALRDFLPKEILVKSKQGFGLPFGIWFNTHAELRNLASQSLHSLAHRGVVRADFINSLINRRMAEHPGYYGEMVWILMTLEKWLQMHAPFFKV